MQIGDAGSSPAIGPNDILTRFKADCGWGFQRHSRRMNGSNTQDWWRMRRPPRMSFQYIQLQGKCLEITDIGHLCLGVRFRTYWLGFSAKPPRLMPYWQRIQISYSHGLGVAENVYNVLLCHSILQGLQILATPDSWIYLYDKLMTMAWMQF